MAVEKPVGPLGTDPAREFNILSITLVWPKLKQRRPWAAHDAIAVKSSLRPY